MLRFLDCFYRDRVLLLAMTAVALILSIGVVAVQPRTYEATARVWVDQSIQGDHPNAYITPADAGNLILGEMLRTRDFCTKVGRRSHLLPPAPGHRSPDRAAEDAVYATLTTAAVLGTAGPNIVTVTFRNRDASLTATTTQAIIDVFKQEILGGQAQRARATVAFYEQQVKSARGELSRADTRITDYVGASLDAAQGALGGSVTPDLSATTVGTTTDVTLMALQRDDDALRRRTDDLTQKLNQARLDLTMAQQSTPNGLRVIDSPITPQRPVSRTASLLAAGAGGLLAGVLLSLLALTALTAADRSLRYPGEVEAALGLQLVGAVPHVE
jgi:uncharacterized protein involved in exopolysaccharide biosynthesis